jgi:hypothetical protein
VVRVSVASPSSSSVERFIKADARESSAISANVVLNQTGASVGSCARLDSHWTRSFEGPKSYRRSGGGQGQHSLSRQIRPCPLHLSTDSCLLRVVRSYVLAKVY